MSATVWDASRCVESLTIRSQDAMLCAAADEMVEALFAAGPIENGCRISGKGCFGLLLGLTHHFSIIWGVPMWRVRRHVPCRSGALPPARLRSPLRRLGLSLRPSARPPARPKHAGLNIAARREVGSAPTLASLWRRVPSRACYPPTHGRARCRPRSAPRPLRTSTLALPFCLYPDLAACVGPAAEII